MKLQAKSEDKLNLYVTALQIIYIILVFTFLLNAFVVDVIVAPPALALLRVPSNIRAIGYLLNAPWTQSLKVYHIFLLIIAVLVLLNLVSLSRLENKTWRSICRISSFLGLFIVWSILLFFTLPFLLTGITFNPVYLKTSLVYVSVSFILLIVDIATFAVAEGLGKNNS